MPDATNNELSNDELIEGLKSKDIAQQKAAIEVLEERTWNPRFCLNLSSNQRKLLAERLNLMLGSKDIEVLRKVVFTFKRLTDAPDFLRQSRHIHEEIAKKLMALVRKEKDVAVQEGVSRLLRFFHDSSLFWETCEGEVDKSLNTPQPETDKLPKFPWYGPKAGKRLKASDASFKLEEGEEKENRREGSVKLQVVGSAILGSAILSRQPTLPKLSRQPTVSQSFNRS